MNVATFLTFSALVCVITKAAPAQNQSEPNAVPQSISVFLDCRGCDESYIRNEINFVNYVRNKEDAGVHILITRERTGSGGREYTLLFLGKKRFTKTSNTLNYISLESDTDDEERRGLVKYIKIGLFPYLLQSVDPGSLTVNYNPENELPSPVKKDPWDNWVFEFDVDTYLEGEESQSRIFLSGGLSVDRVTPKWKTELDYDYYYNRRRFTEEDSNGEETTDVFISRDQRYEGLLVQSLNKHWSLGVFSEAYSSTRDNIDLGISGSPAIEYNIFPYPEYAERELSFRYTLGPVYRNYAERTIFNKRSQLLAEQQFESNLDINQPWGEIQGEIEISSFLHDLNKSRIDFNLELDIRVYRGLSVTFYGSYSWINDQLFLPQSGITSEEQLLDLRQQATSYSFNMSIGLEYTFGSIYNNVVNPRF